MRNASTYSWRYEEKSPEHYTKFHEVKTADWKYVDRLIPPLVIPDYPVKDSYVSGWKPPSGKEIVLYKLLIENEISIFIHLDSASAYQFFVKRTKNHMIPVYLNFEAVRDQRKITLIKNIEGDIWVSIEHLKYILLNFTEIYFKHLRSWKDCSKSIYKPLKAKQSFLKSMK